MLILGCAYDRALLYHEGYVLGESDKLRIDGFYDDPTVDLNNPHYSSTYVRSIFFYGDGSVFFMHLPTDTADLRVRLNYDNDPLGIWGNYTVFDDTIRIETIESYGGSRREQRSTMVGLVGNEQIHFIQKINRKGRITPLDYTITFYHYNIKPDSTNNWIRTNKKVQ